METQQNVSDSTSVLKMAKIIAAQMFMQLFQKS